MVVAVNKKVSSIFCLALLISCLLVTTKGDVVADDNKGCHSIARYFNLLEFDVTWCPNEHWLLSFREVDPNPHKVMINIGVNKGYNLAFWAGIWYQTNPQVNMQVWYEYLKKFGIDQCGNCGDCNPSMGFSHNVLHNSHQDEELVLLGLDLNVNNLNLINNISSALKTDYKNWANVTLKTVLAAMSNNKENMWVRKCVAGDEECDILSPEKAKTMGSTELNDKYMSVDTYNMDEFVEYLKSTIPGHGTYDVHRHSPHFANLTLQQDHNLVIDILQMDAEGYDAEILLGGSKALAEHLIRVVMF
jgi:hypothetical protein